MDSADKKIYRVKGDRIISADIVRETRCYYWIDDSKFQDFGFRTRFEKEHACTSPGEAAQEELNSALTLFGMYKDRLDVATKRLEVAKKLKAAVVRQ